MGGKSPMSIENKLQKWLSRLTWQQAFHYILTSTALLLFALFFDWLIINWISGCCEGGVCIPKWLYPSCKADGGSHD
jgi:hypothetical protein